MEGFFLEMGWMLAALFIGVCIGSLTGLIPGFHVNNVALILLGVSPALLAIGIPLSAAAGIIVATGVVHFPWIYSLSTDRCARCRYSSSTVTGSQNVTLWKCA